MFGAGHDGCLFTGVTGGHSAVGAATGHFDQLSNKIFFFFCVHTTQTERLNVTGRVKGKL